MSREQSLPEVVELPPEVVEPTVPVYVLQRDLDFYRRRYREQRAEIKDLRNRLTECRAKYVRAAELVRHYARLAGGSDE